MKNLAAYILAVVALAMPVHAQSTNAPPAPDGNPLGVFHAQLAAFEATGDLTDMSALALSKITGNVQAPDTLAANENNYGIHFQGVYLGLTTTKQAAHDYYIAHLDYGGAAAISVQMRNIPQAITETQEEIAQSTTFNIDPGLIFTQNCALLALQVRAGTKHNADVVAMLATGTYPMRGDAAAALYGAYNPTLAAKADAIAFYTQVEALLENNGRNAPLIGKCQDQIAKLSL
jgi:hypothetical protein